jgi:uncharacterized membrane protein YbhN (UPF0104 family)
VSAQPEGLDLGSAAKRGAFFVVVLVAVVVLILTLPGVGDIRDRLSDANPWWVVAMFVCAVTSVLGYVRALWAVFDRVLAWPRALVLGLAEQGANVLLPAGGAGGPALGAYVMTRLGVPAELASSRHAALFLATSAVTFVALAVCGTLTAVGLLPSDVSEPWRIVPAAVAAVIIGLGIAYARLPSPREPARGGIVRLLWRARLFVHDGARLTYQLLRGGDRFLVVGAVTYFAADVASLGCAFAAVGGGGPPLGDFVLAYALGHLGALLPTPGGVGGTEGGLIGMLVVYGAPASSATAAVLGYRVFQLGMPVVLGAISMLRIRTRLNDAERRAAVQARFAELGY